ncbi:cupin domain-containing protein [Parapedobacter tibetensis]|uniref:cupin domain-containing protein n=1 Tax=Parapedobacter tibetensis TaxID=2972951 RepID=UPI00214D5B05|nr:cupin domain-containing protein [Parapedobacter tibetensis]
MTKQIIIIIVLSMDILTGKAQTPRVEGAGNKSGVQDYLADKLVNAPVVMAADAGESLEMLGSKLTFKLTTESTNNQMGLYEVKLAPQVSGAKLHYHRFMDETFVVTKGTLTVQLIDREVEIGEGGVIHIPRFTPHGFYNGTDEEVMALMLFNPPQHREDFFRGMKEVLSEEPMDASKFLQLYHKYDSHPIDESEAADVLRSLQ